MPKGKSAEQYKRASVINGIIGVIMLAALIAGLYYLFVFLLEQDFLKIM